MVPLEQLLLFSLLHCEQHVPRLLLCPAGASSDSVLLDSLDEVQGNFDLVESGVWLVGEISRLLILARELEEYIGIFLFLTTDSNL